MHLYRVQPPFSLRNVFARRYYAIKAFYGRGRGDGGVRTLNESASL